MDFEYFAEIVHEREDLQLALEWIGEGFEGDYDEEDPDDAPLLRLTALYRESGEWEQVEDASYCTVIDARSDRELLSKALPLLFERVWGAYDPGDAPYFGLKRTLEDLSHLDEAELRRAVRAADAREYAAAPAAPPVGEIGERSRPSGLAE